MNVNNLFNLNRQACIALMVSAAFPTTLWAAAGRVEFSIGGVTAIGSDGRARPLTKGSEVNAGDTIQTTDGRVQVKFTDGGYMSFQPQTQFKIEDYNYSGKTDGSEKSFFRLVEGGLRAITGAIGHVNRPNYKLSTPVATIGIRGTEYIAVYRQNGQQLYLSTVNGALYVKNDQGDMVLYKGQSGEVNGNGSPQRTDNLGGVTAQGPDNTKSTQNQQDKQRQDNTIFTVNEQYTNDGTPLAFSSSADTLAAIQTYAAANAIGQYILVDDSTNIGSAASYYDSLKLIDDGSTKFSRFTVFFGTGNISSSIAVAGTYNGGSGPVTDFVQFSGSGNLNTANAALNMTLNSGSNGFGFNCYSNCVLTATGALKGPTAQQAAINYSIEGGSIGGGSANFNAPVIPAASSSPP
ncbi:MAG: FecR domain-containing protein [Candidatus Methylopumilus sp.]|jgi:hypothetical protein